METETVIISHYLQMAYRCRGAEEFLIDFSGISWMHLSKTKKIFEKLNLSYVLGTIFTIFDECVNLGVSRDVNIDDLLLNFSVSASNWNEQFFRTQTEGALKNEGRFRCK